MTDIQPAEYAERQERARAAAAARGLRALLSFSRAHDRIANGLWLAGLATSQPFVPDLAGHWRATGHVVLAAARLLPEHLMGGFWGH